MSAAHAVGSFEQKFALSERLRCETKDNKVCICSSGVQAFDFRNAFKSDAEISELWSIELLGILRLVVGVCNLYFLL